MAFLLISLSIVALLYGYTGWRLLLPLPLPSPWSSLAWLVLGCLALLPHTHILLRRHLEYTWWNDALSWVTYSVLGLVVLLFSLLLVRDLGWLGWTALEWLSGLPGRGEATPPASVDPARRQLLLGASSAVVFGVGLTTAGWGLYQARRRPQVVEVEVPVSGLPPALHGFRIAQITDLHVGPTLRGDFVQTVVDAVNRLEPDIIVLTGDLADGAVAHLESEVAPLAGLRSRHGSYFVTGNHEYYSGVGEWLAAVRRLGFTVLVDEHRVLDHQGGRLLLAGVADFGAADFVPTHRSDPQAALAGAPPADARILLAHQPRSIWAAARAGFDLQLSGHTHGGQFLPWKYLVRLQQPFLEGLHRAGDTWVYVSRGTGYWGPPLRLAAPSEISLVRLCTA